MKVPEIESRTNQKGSLINIYRFHFNLSMPSQNQYTIAYIRYKIRYIITDKDTYKSDLQISFGKHKNTNITFLVKKNNINHNMR